MSLETAIFGVRENNDLVYAGHSITIPGRYSEGEKFMI